MALRFAFVLLLSVFSYGMAIPAFPHDIPMQKPHADPECPANEVFNPCGSACAPTCANPSTEQMCTKQCIVGCFCKEGYLRNAQGTCVQTRDCDAVQPNMLFAYPPELSQCKDNEIFLPCGSACPPTCDNPSTEQMCTKQCVAACFCKPGYLKNEQGVCVTSTNCGVRPEDAIPIPPRKCGQNEIFRQCKGCDGTCKNPDPLCPRICIPGCACKQGYLRSESGKCIETRECSAQVQQASFMMPVPKCPANEIFHSCGTACPATCSNPHPSPVCTKNCVIGCFCKEGYLRNAQGACVETRECNAPLNNNIVLAQVEGKCATDREIYTECGNQLDCLNSCGTPPPFLIRDVPQIPEKCAKMRCAPACACKRPYARNESGVCVERSQCEHKNPFVNAQPN